MLKNKFSGFYKKSIPERQKFVQQWMDIEEYQSIPQLPREIGNQLIENYIGNYEIPMGVALNISVNDKEYLIPMAIEEPSVLAAVSNGGKILGNISAETKSRELIGQIIFESNINLKEAQQRLETHYQELMDFAKDLSASMVRRGGGPQKFFIDEKNNGETSFMSLYLSFDPCDAMGANVINSLLEALNENVEEIFEAEILMSILSNYQEENLTLAQVSVDYSKIHEDSQQSIKLAYAIEKASEYANLDVYRAVTHNKGVMNGIDAVLVATGNDWRAVEAGVNAFAARTGQYQAITQWKVKEETKQLIGRIEIPLQVATVGGTLSSHPIARWALGLMKIENAREFANVLASVGLIQNFSALRALIGDGIQKGHMAMQARSLALRVGAEIHEIDKVVEELKKVQIMNQETTLKILNQLRRQ